MISTRMDELINAILDGEASEREVAELESLVGDDPELSSQLADRIAEHRLLGLIHQPFDSAMCVDSVMEAIRKEEQSTTEHIVGTVFDSAAGVTSGSRLRQNVQGTKTHALASVATAKYLVTTTAD